MSANIALVNESVVWATRWHNIEWVSPLPAPEVVILHGSSHPSPAHTMGNVFQGLTPQDLSSLMGTNIRNEGNGITHTVSKIIIWWLVWASHNQILCPSLCPKYYWSPDSGDTSESLLNLITVRAGDVTSEIIWGSDTFIIKEFSATMIWWLKISCVKNN